MTSIVLILMLPQVRCTLFCIESNSAMASLEGRYAVRFFQLLDPLHVPPQRVPFLRILRLLEEAVFREYRRIVNDNVQLYGADFASTNSDFFTSKERRETFGCIVGNMLAQRYHFAVRLACVLSFVLVF